MDPNRANLDLYDLLWISVPFKSRVTRTTWNYPTCVRAINVLVATKFEKLNMTSAEPGRKAPYSRDIRWRVIWQRIRLDLPFKKIAENLYIAASIACSHYKRFEVTGDVSSTKPSRRELYVIGLFFSSPSLYLHEVCREVNSVLGNHVSAPTACLSFAGKIRNYKEEDTASGSTAE